MDQPFSGTATEAYKRSGIREAVEQVGGVMEIMASAKYTNVDFPKTSRDLRSLKIYQDILKFEKPAELLILRDIGDWKELAEKGRKVAARMSEETARLERVEAELGEITLGIKCGGSDTSSGVVSNPVAGIVADRIIQERGTAIFTETPEILGAEHVLARRAVTKDVADKVFKAARTTELRIEEMGVDLRGSEPTPANIQGGTHHHRGKVTRGDNKGRKCPLAGCSKLWRKTIRQGALFYGWAGSNR